MSLLQDWAIRVAEEADGNAEQVVARSSKRPATVEGPHTNTAARSCLGLEGDNFPPSYDDEAHSESSTPSILERSPLRRPVSEYTRREGAPMRPGTRAPNVEENDASVLSKLGVCMRARPLLWTIEDVARDSMILSDSGSYFVENQSHTIRRRRSSASSPIDAGVSVSACAGEKLPPWRQPSITRSAFPSAYGPAPAPHVGSNPPMHASQQYNDSPPAYAPPPPSRPLQIQEMSPQMCSIPGAYPPSPVVAEAPQCQPLSYPPSPSRPRYYQHRASDSQYVPPPSYGTAVSSQHGTCHCASVPHPHHNAACSGLGLTFQPTPAPSLPHCPHSGCTHAVTHATVPLTISSIPNLNAVHITVALQARKSPTASVVSFLAPLGLALLLVLPLSLMLVTMVSSYSSAGCVGRSSSSSASSVHASLIWRALSSLLAYVFRALGDGDGKL